jgi:hypothetical protein
MGHRKEYFARLDQGLAVGVVSSGNVSFITASVNQDADDQGPENAFVWPYGCNPQDIWCHCRCVGAGRCIPRFSRA